MHAWIGAMMVGSICMTKQEGDDVKRGEETGEPSQSSSRRREYEAYTALDRTGYFKFGGSTIVCLFNDVQFDQDLVDNSRNSVRDGLGALGSCRPFADPVNRLSRAD